MSKYSDSDSDEYEGTWSTSSGGSSRIRPTGRVPRVSVSSLCGLTFPVPRIKAMLKVNHYAGRISEKSAIFLTAALEYLTAEMIELSLNVARTAGRNRIKPKHIHEALNTDGDMKRIFKNSTIPGGCFVPFHPVPLIPGLPRTAVRGRDEPGPSRELQNEPAPSRARSVSKSPRRRRG